MKKGFTLVEILVAVLIIGVLSSIALAQYQRAVKRARGTEALRVVGALKTALAAYALENGSFAGLMSEDVLSVSLPRLKHWRYCQVGTACSLSYPSWQSGSGSSRSFSDVYGTSDFPGCFAHGSPMADCQIGLINEEGASLNIIVSSPSKTGSLQFSLLCAGSFETCADYFPCGKHTSSHFSSTTMTEVTSNTCILSL